MHIFSPLNLREGSEAIQIPFKNTMFNVKKKINLLQSSWAKLHKVEPSRYYQPNELRNEILAELRRCVHTTQKEKLFQKGWNATWPYHCACTAIEAFCLTPYFSGVGGGGVGVQGSHIMVKVGAYNFFLFILEWLLGLLLYYHIRLE